MVFNLNKNQTKIIEETNQIIINIPVDHIKIKEILFIVYEKIKNDKETINELLSIVSNMNEKINNLEKENEIIKQYLPYLEKYKKNKMK